MKIDKELKFCVLQDTVTPIELPVKMDGFMDRKELSKGVHDDLYVKVVLMEANKTLLFIAFDLCMSERAPCDSIKAEIKKSHGLSEEQIMISFTHTHSGVSLPSDLESTYFKYVKSKVTNLVSCCYNQLETGFLYYAKGETHAAVSRRLPTPGGIKWAPSFDSKIDKDLFIMKLTDTSGEIKAIMYNFGCHNTSLGPSNLLISNDFIGFANKCLSEKFNGAKAIFLTGAGADCKPMSCAMKDLHGDYIKDKFIECSMEQSQNAGIQLAAEIINVIEEGKFHKINPSFKASLQTITLFGPKPDFDSLNAKTTDPLLTEIRRNRAKKLLEKCIAGNYKTTIDMYVSLWSLGDEVRIAALGCELVSALGIKIKDIFRNDKTLVMGYTNEVIGYVADSVQAAEGGYESDAFMVWDFAGPLLPHNDKVICNAIKALEFDLT